MDQQSCVALFLRSPEKGRVKTRLTSVLDEDSVVKIYRLFVLDILRTLKTGGFGLRIYFHPPDARSNVADWLGDGYHYVAQEGEDLGERMKNAFLTAFAEGFSKVVVIGSDFPDLPCRIVEEALSSLSSNDAVIGPATDGGYYLIGFNSQPLLKDVFSHMDWGTPSVFRRTMDVLKRNGYAVWTLPQWRDIDAYGDLMNFMRDNELTPDGCLLTLDYLRAQKRIRDL